MKCKNCGNEQWTFIEEIVSINRRKWQYVYRCLHCGNNLYTKHFIENAAYPTPLGLADKLAERL